MSSNSSFFGRISARSSFISPKDVKVTVQLLNDADTISNEFKRTQPAQSILDYICEVKGIREKDFLGLRYQDHLGHRYWVDLAKPIAHTLKSVKHDSVNLYLRFRFYPADATHINEPCTRYQLFVQLQRDLIHGRLYCSTAKAAQLSALILQSQLGDYDPNVYGENYVSQYKLFLKQSPPAEEKIAELHKSFQGMSTEEAETEFLRLATTIDTYGFDPYTVKDPKDGSDVFIGTNSRGILVFHARQKVHSIEWDKLAKVDYIAKELKIITTNNYAPPAVDDLKEAEKVFEKDKKQRIVLKYNCANGHFAKHLWNHILSQQAFFNEQSALMIKPKFSKPRIPLLSRGSTFRYPSQRVLREIERSHDDGAHVDHNQTCPLPTTEFVRYELSKQEPRAPQPWLDCRNNRTMEVPPLTRKITSTEPVDVSACCSMDAIPTSPIAMQSHVLFDESSGPSTSFSAPEKLNLSADSPRQNQASFTVHLVKFERNATASPESSSPSSTVVSDSPPAEPLLTSTPLPTHKFNGDAKINGKLNGVANGSTPQESQALNHGRWTNAFFGSFLTLLIILTLFIALFERQEGQDLVASSSWLSTVQHSYYEPARHFVLQQYGKYLKR